MNTSRLRYLHGRTILVLALATLGCAGAVHSPPIADDALPSDSVGFALAVRELRSYLAPGLSIDSRLTTLSKASRYSLASSADDGVTAARLARLKTSETPSADLLLALGECPSARLVTLATLRASCARFAGTIAAVDTPVRPQPVAVGDPPAYGFPDTRALVRVVVANFDGRGSEMAGFAVALGKRDGRWMAIGLVSLPPEP